MLCWILPSFQMRLPFLCFTAVENFFLVSLGNIFEFISLWKMILLTIVWFSVMLIFIILKHSGCPILNFKKTKSCQVKIPFKILSSRVIYIKWRKVGLLEKLAYKNTNIGLQILATWKLNKYIKELRILYSSL